MFRDYFKYYKRKKPPPSYENVIDVAKDNSHQVRRMALEELDVVGDITIDSINKVGLKPINCWEAFEFSNIAGLVYIKNPFTTSGQRYWMIKCLKDYTRKPNKLNIDEHKLLRKDEAWWDICTRNDEPQRALELTPKLRWITLGYHHNWNSKHYSEYDKTAIPQDLGELTKIIGRSLQFNDLKAEAAIINFYGMNSTLAGHVDCSENNLDAPLISISFGQSAIFLIGGVTSEDAAQPIFLHSGDIIAMSGESRLRYHGIPKILKAQNCNCWQDTSDQSQYDIPTDEADWSKAEAFISQTRININIRQVLHAGQNQLIAS